MKKVLIIEDNQIVANVYRNKLAVEGYRTEAALDGETGLELTRSFQPDAIVLDIILPKMSGVEVIKLVRSQTAFAQLPIIVLSNTYSTNLIQQAWKAGATKCVSKIDCPPKALVELMRQTIGDSGAMKTRTAAGGAPKPQPAAAENKTDAVIQSDLRKNFIAGLPGLLATLRGNMQNLVKADNETARLKQIYEIYDRVHTINGNASLAGLAHIAHMAAALEVLLKELYDNPKNITDSTLRTTAIAVDFFHFLSEHGTKPGGQVIPPPSVLVVDDENIACRAIAYALGKAHLQPTIIENPGTALEVLAQKSFDMVLLDVDMPGMSGHELCSKLRALPQHRQTPVVFVTRLTDFASRAKSNVVGGNDFIAKPFLPIELTVKALIHILRTKLQPPKA